MFHGKGFKYNKYPDQDMKYRIQLLDSPNDQFGPTFVATEEMLELGVPEMFEIAKVLVGKCDV